jgi:hypothetical protein
MRAVAVEIVVAEEWLAGRTPEPTAGPEQTPDGS